MSQNITGAPAAQLDKVGSAPPSGVDCPNISFEAVSRAARLGFSGEVPIADVLSVASTLPTIQKEQILRLLKASTGMPIGELRREITALTGSRFDDLALARMAVETIDPANIIFTAGRFWLWGSGVWKPVDPVAVKQTVQGVLERAQISVTASKVNSVTDLVRNETFRRDHRFNQGPPDIINCTNGELQLSGGEWTFERHRRDLFRTTQIPVAYAYPAACPQFDQFLRDVFRDDEDRAAKAQSVLELIGYTLMSHARYERFVMLIGGGANGKSVLLSVIRALVGAANCAGVQPSRFGSAFQRAHLEMKLANIVTELPQGAVMADAELKAITSGEVTTVEHKGCDPFDLSPYATCWFGTNHMPHTRDFSDALFRRATIFTFNRTFAPHEQDATLADRLAGELPGILVRAAQAYQNATIAGFTAPPSSEVAKAKWRREADQVQQFVDERCSADPMGRVAVDEIYRRFKSWAADSGVSRIVGKQAMGDRLERLGFARLRSNGSWITGVALRSG